MNATDAKRDYAYFASLWENGGSAADGRKALSAWDSRADDWAKLLDTDSAFRRNLDERVVRASEYLRSRGLLRAEDEVIDIGCGPGRFVAEFARTAGHVTGVDISERMLAHGEQYARGSGVLNTSYFTRDFKTVDIAAEGWAGRFDLVFTSITPAIGNLECVHKSIRMSRGFCFNSSYIHYTDGLEEQISREVFAAPLPYESAWDGRWFYALLNLLWLDGYYPETCYHRQLSDDMVPADEELTRYYTRLFSSRLNGEWSETETLIGDYLQRNSDSGGFIRQCTERRFGWILWDVRQRDKRM